MRQYISDYRREKWSTQNNSSHLTYTFTFQAYTGEGERGGREGREKKIEEEKERESE